jgi:hypothetical protein
MAEIADIGWVGVVEIVLAAEDGGRRKLVRLDEAADIGDAPGLQPPPPRDQERAFRIGEPGQHLADGRGVRKGVRLPIGPAGIGLDPLDEHVLGQGQDHRAGPAGHGRLIARCRNSGMRRASSISATHLAMPPNICR